MARAHRGLSGAEAARRLDEVGPNRIVSRRPVRFLSILREELGEPMILLLLAVAVGYFLFGERLEAFLVLGIILGILLIEVWTEFRAKRAIGALGRLSEPAALVVRDGNVQEIPVEGLVPGDLLLLREGSHVPADALLLRADDLAVDESPLTGESLPVEKEVAPQAPAAEQAGRVFRGTTVTRGEAFAEVTATGSHTQLGQIAVLAESARAPRTPLQTAMRELSRVLVWVALGFAVLIPLLSLLWGGVSWQEALLSGLSLAFATIPEELPILVTVVLGLGALRLARQRALVRGLRPAETLGHLTTIVTDKTGTLTENRLRLSRCLPLGAAEGVDLKDPTSELLTAAYRSLGITPGGDALLTDPLERALADGLSRLAGTATEDKDMAPKRIPFTRERGWSGARWPSAAGYRFHLKGAPEVVLRHADGLTRGEKDAVIAAVERLAGAGYRMLAVASAETADENLPERWRYLGLLALEDPLRPEARAAVETVRKAGVRVYMATGDHPEIARAIARKVGLPAERAVTGPELERMSRQGLEEALRTTFLFARITPAHKLRLVQALQAEGHIVAMTGDGINDAPALKAADVGIAMGLGGTDAAREAASLVLTDDRFATLASALREGRGLFANLQKAVRYYLAVKVGLILVMLLPALFGFSPPLAPIMIILLELFMDLAASTAFVVEAPETALMAQAPRPPEAPFLDAEMRRGIVAGGLLLAVAVLFSAWLGSRLGGEGLYRTGAFAAWMLGHVVLAFRFRSWRAPLRPAGLFSNRVLNLWALGALLATLLVSYLPWFQAVFGTSPLPASLWLFTLLSVLLVVGVGGGWAGAGMGHASQIPVDATEPRPASSRLWPRRQKMEEKR